MKKWVHEWCNLNYEAHWRRSSFVEHEEVGVEFGRSNPILGLFPIAST